MNLRVTFLALLGVMFLRLAGAQSITPSEVNVPSQGAGAAASLLQAPMPKAKVAKIPGLEDDIEPFGANLFSGGFSAEREDGLNPNYVVSRGDQINLRIWGAVEFNNTVIVDHQGNIFVPGVGPVKVAGTQNRYLNRRVVAAVRTVFTDNVNVYTSLNGAQPVAVFVTGFVPNPGRFAGIPSNSALYFLDRAGGIDPERGSYRTIRVLRDSREIAVIDLYDFIINGRLEKIQYQDGDTLVVAKRGSTVEVTGDVNNSALFEFNGDSVLGKDIAESVQTKPGVSYVGVSGIRENQPFSNYLSIDEFRQMPLSNGDQLSFRVDNHDDIIVVDIEGAFKGPSRFAIPVNTRLPELLDHIPVDLGLTDTGSVSIRRKSVVERQKVSLENSLRRLESQYLTAASQTDGEAAIRAQEARMVTEFVASAREVEPNGRLVVASNGKVADVVLKNGDVITLPSRSESVLLSGEVLVTQALLWKRGMTAREYIDRSGGYSQQADKKRIVLVHANGEVTTAEDPLVRAGDEIIVLPRVPVKNLQIASVIVDILYKIAVAASVAVKL